MRMADVPVDRMLDKAYARELAGEIDPKRARPLLTATPPRHPDTIYLSVVDRDLNACSFINSVYDSFGTGLSCPNTGVVFQSRGRAFDLEEGHRNELAPRKRPLHTIIPAMAMQNGEVAASFGVMGGEYQPVGHAHTVTSLVDFALDAQAAMDSPRSMAYPGPLKVERGLPEATVRGLVDRGHETVMPDAPLGGGQIIRIDRRRGVLEGGSDPRKDGLAIGY